MENAVWITTNRALGDVCPIYRKVFKISGNIKNVTLCVTALGVYDAKLNGNRISDYVLAPGWTSYEKRIQVQTYDVTSMLDETNELQLTVGRGWFASPMVGWEDTAEKRRRYNRPDGLLAELSINYTDGTSKTICTDESWQYAESPIRFSEIYDGETYNANIIPEDWYSVSKLEWPKDMLIPQEGELIVEQEHIPAQRIFTAPNGEIIVDFGQEITGYAEISITAEKDDIVRISHAEMLDSDGNFYNENYRSAKSQLCYICKDGAQTYHPIHTFFGFRYLRLDEFPVQANPEMFTAISVYSDIKQTGILESGHKKLNQLFSNIFWGQRGNFLDVPTDCPQRDERLGWTGDAQVFIKAASYNYDVERFFIKWLHDLAADQCENGAVADVIPDYFKNGHASVAWGDAATICPWQIYMTYGNVDILEQQFDSMKRWVDYITNATATQYLWTGGEHYADWLGLDAPSGSYKGSSREDFIASAFYAYSTGLLIKAGEVLGEDVAAYKELHMRIIEAFREQFPDYKTQTEYALAVQFELCEDPQKTADALAELIKADGSKMQTGFVGTPYLLHVLSRYGHTKLAYSLLLREEYPSWLYSVNKGATTIWEHWDGVMEDGSFWSSDMNSFNHYAYGAVADWVYEEAAGIQPLEAGFAKIRIAPKPDARLGHLNVSIKTRQGLVASDWHYEQDKVIYKITTPVASEIAIDGKTHQVSAGYYQYESYKIF